METVESCFTFFSIVYVKELNGVKMVDNDLAKGFCLIVCELPRCLKINRLLTDL